MQILKKTGLFMSIVLLMLFGNKVEAADVQTEQIVAKTTEAMKNVKVVATKISLKNPQTKQYELFAEIAVDANSGVSYMEIMESKIWTDEKAGITYFYNSETKQYEFCPFQGDNINTTVTADIPDEVIDSSLKTTYLGEENGLYKLQGISEDGKTSYIYTIDKNTYLITQVESVSSAEQYEALMEYSYPSEVVIPEEVKKNAELMEGYQLTKGNISYSLTKVKGKRVWYVITSKKAKNAVKIPDSVSINGKTYDVYGIRKKAFYNNGKIKSVTIGNNVKVIEDQAFYNNKKMTSLTIGKNVRTIGQQSFYKCKKLKNVKINSKNITKIGSHAFYGNAKTLKFKVPKKKAKKYEKLIKKSTLSSKLVITKY